MIKFAEYVKHSLTEPLLLVYLYKKVEDGKVVAAFRIQMYRNMAFVVYEDDKLKGGEVVDVMTGSVESVVKAIEKYYEKDVDDLVIYGEENYVDQLLKALEVKGH
ncbi:MAG: hypothetical protein TQ35_0009690 [Candidatus Aramenus sulfurataquae]|jgi:antitoxin component YwqK of YwqJK toxin-antitoxin module|uniref:Uncharacterized protein n=2 Tax=Candidatus Aramenus sulfurataquae TaxID=1326980 RepID=A0AAE3FLU3_9CREN|nr:hypothetical protein [Candidatus Aramenus sulfurataquae]